MEKTIETWESKEGVNLLKKIGIKLGQTILDFGAKNGHYTMPVAKIVGRKGVVYALDKNSSSLDKLMEKAKRKNLDNIKRIDTSNKLRIPLKRETIDVVLLYDVIHLVGKEDSSTINDRKRLYKEVYRVTKLNGLISVYPSHLKTHTDVTSNEKIKGEIEEAGFRLEKEIYEELIHDENKVKGDILNFRKRLK